MTCSVIQAADPADLALQSLLASFLLLSARMEAAQSGSLPAYVVWSVSNQHLAG